MLNFMDHVYGKATAKGAVRVETALVHFLRNVLRPSPLSHLISVCPFVSFILQRYEFLSDDKDALRPGVTRLKL
jgi:hypothetical protein